MTEKPRKRRHGDRRDGIWLRDLDPMHGFTPYLYPNRADNEAFIEETIDLTNMNRYIAEKNAQNPEVPLQVLPDHPRRHRQDGDAQTAHEPLLSPATASISARS